MCLVAAALTFYCHHFICPFPSLTNEPEEPGQDLSVDLDEDHCCGVINNAKKGRSPFVQGIEEDTSFSSPSPLTDFLRPVSVLDLDKKS